MSDVKSLPPKPSLLTKPPTSSLPPPPISSKLSPQISKNSLSSSDSKTIYDYPKLEPPKHRSNDHKRYESVYDDDNESCSDAYDDVDIIDALNALDDDDNNPPEKTQTSSDAATAVAAILRPALRLSTTKSTAVSSLIWEEKSWFAM